MGVLVLTSPRSTRTARELFGSPQVKGSGVGVRAPLSFTRWNRLLPALSGVIEGDDGTIWMATRGGIRRLVGDKAVEYPLLGRRQFRATSLFRDRDGGLWIGTVDRGVLHYYRGKTDIFGRSDGLSNDDVTQFFEDREGCIWVTTNGGLDRFREFAVPRFSVKQGLSADSISSVLAARDGSLWLASYNGLNRWKNGKINVYRGQSWSREGEVPDSNQIVDRGLPSSSFQSLFEDSLGRIWVSTPAGLATFEDGHFVRGSNASRNVFGMVEDRADSFWISDYSEGLLHLVQGGVLQRTSWNEINRNRGFGTGLVRDLSWRIVDRFLPGRCRLFPGRKSSQIRWTLRASMSFASTRRARCGPQPKRD